MGVDKFWCVFFFIVSPFCFQTSQYRVVIQTLPPKASHIFFFRCLLSIRCANLHGKARPVRLLAPLRFLSTPPSSPLAVPPPGLPNPFWCTPQCANKDPNPPPPPTTLTKTNKLKHKPPKNNPPQTHCSFYEFFSPIFLTCKYRISLAVILTTFLIPPYEFCLLP